MYEAIVGLFFKGLELLYKWISENLLVHIMTFGKEFGTLIVFVSAVAFLLITVYFIMKQAKRLPRKYVLESYDHEGKLVVIPELRVSFATYQAATSYAEFYTGLYKDEYKFKILGIRDNISILRRLSNN